jgi:hypothetical protein
MASNILAHSRAEEIAPGIYDVTVIRTEICSACSRLKITDRLCQCRKPVR